METEKDKKESEKQVKAKSIKPTKTDKKSTTSSSEEAVQSANSSSAKAAPGKKPKSPKKAVVKKKTEDKKVKSPKPKEEKTKAKESKVKPASPVSVEGQDDHEEYEFHEDDLHNEEVIPFEKLNKAELLEKIKDLSGRPVESVQERVINELHNYFFKQVEKDKENALKDFVAGGEEKENFEFRGDNEIIHQFDEFYKSFKEKKRQYFGEIEKVREKNLALKEELLEKLRTLVDGEVEDSNIRELKEIESSWRKAEPIQAQRARELWANFNALRDRFYDQRSILFELKDLDRKKNLSLKEEIIEKAEQLLSRESMLNAVSELKKLHEEYKHIGPVPKEVRGVLWEKFRAISDKIHDKRREVSVEFKKVLESNQGRKEELIANLKSLQNFASDRINDWNAKTKEVLALRDEWKKAGPTPKSGAKEISHEFWANFKGFFKHKQEFFKEIDKRRNDNFDLKIKLCEEVESIKDQEDWEGTAIRIKEIQREWRDIGPVPRKKSDELYGRFKQCCDEFFNRRRDLLEERGEEFKENLQKKNEICEKIAGLGVINEKNQLEVQKMVSEWMGLGFVEREKIKSSRNKLKESLEKLLAKMDRNSEEFQDYSLRIEAMLANAGAGGDPKLLQDKIDKFKRQISGIQKEAETLKLNVEMFSRGPAANKLKEGVHAQIRAAEEKISNLKNKIKILRD